MRKIAAASSSCMDLDIEGARNDRLARELAGLQRFIDRARAKQVLDERSDEAILASVTGSPLLYKGRDVDQTDVARAR